jgi:hypothetical protein
VCRFRKNRLYQRVDPPQARPTGQAHSGRWRRITKISIGVFCAKFFGLLVLGVGLLGLALRAQDDGQIEVGRSIERIELDGGLVFGDRRLGPGAERSGQCLWLSPD